MTEYEAAKARVRRFMGGETSWKIYRVTPASDTVWGLLRADLNLIAEQRDGWVMVPREPTEAMLDAARYFWGPYLDEERTQRAGRRSDDPAEIERARAVWAQMLSSLPPAVEESKG